MNIKRSAMAATLLVAGCASVHVGQPFDLKAFEARVQRGVSTQADVREWLGAPAGRGVSVESSGERHEQWTYYHGTGRLPAMAEARLDVLQVKFDERGVVRAYNWSGDADPPSR